MLLKVLFFTPKVATFIPYSNFTKLQILTKENIASFTNIFRRKNRLTVRLAVMVSEGVDSYVLFPLPHYRMILP